MKLTEHFTDSELGVAGAGQRLIDSATFLCSQILEPIRAKFGPVHVHDGYRSPEHNASVGGKPTSYHQFNGTQAAVDIDVLPTSYEECDQWIRLESGLPFDKVILEFHAPPPRGDGKPAAVHIQVDTEAKPRRLAYKGSTGAGTVYVPQEVR